MLLLSFFAATAATDYYRCQWCTQLQFALVLTVCNECCRQVAGRQAAGRQARPPPPQKIACEAKCALDTFHSNSNAKLFQNLVYTSMLRFGVTAYTRSLLIKPVRYTFAQVLYTCVVKLVAQAVCTVHWLITIAFHYLVSSASHTFHYMCDCTCVLTSSA